MATSTSPVRRLLLLSGFAVALAAAPAITALTTPESNAPANLAACTPGEEEDVFTTVCTPFLVPNSSSTFQSIPGNPDIPAVDGIPCTGRNAGQCIGLAEEEQAMGPQPVPRSTISASP